MSLVVMIYETTKAFPREEQFGLSAQLRRAAVSVPSNIAEGLTRNSKRDKLQFLNIARASLSEIDAQMEIASRLRILEESHKKAVDEALTIVEQLLNGLMRSLRT